VSDLLDPVETIRAHLSRWREPVVDLDTFGTAEPEAMAAMVDGFCRDALGSGVAGYLFCAASQGSTHGVGLADGRRVVVKLHPAPGAHPDRRHDRLALESIRRAVEHLHAHGFACPRPLAGPTPLGRGLAMAEEFLDAGERGDGFDPDCRRTLARGLFEVTTLLTPLRQELPGLHSFFQPAERRYPVPHSRLFDFEATADTAGWIDSIADRARAASVHPGPVVVGHADWRVEHLRFGGGRITASYDWDSVLPLPETQLVGITAASYTTDWSGEGRGRVPTVGAMHEFVAAYEDARGARFGRPERDAIFAMAVYAAAYGARCQHSLAPERGPAGWPDDSWPALLRAAAREL
jgi:hypothetical protein